MNKLLVQKRSGLWYPDSSSQEAPAVEVTTHLNPKMLDETPRIRALRELRRMITDGVLAVGESVPPEREIAARLGISLSSVQRALKTLEQDGLLVRGRGRERKIAHTQPDESGLLADTVIVMGEEGFNRPIVNPVRGWGAFVAVGALHALGDGGEHTLVIKPQELTRQRMERLLRGRPHGLIIPEVVVAGWDSAFWARLSREANVPVAIYGDEAGGESFDRVAPDHHQGAYELTKLLLSRGRRMILQQMPEVHPRRWMLARRSGYERAMQEAGLTPLPPLYLTLEVGQGQSEAAHRSRVQMTLGALVIASKPSPIDAVMALSDWCVTPLVHALRDWGKTPNQDIDVVGYDDFWEEVKLPADMQPERPLASIDKNNLESGQQLVSLLRDRIAGKLPPEPQCILIPPILKSCE